MKKLFVRLLIFSLAYFLFDKLFLPIRNQAPEREVDKRLEYIITGKIKSDILVYGSSRGARSVIASQITDSTGISAYNLSFPGSDITFHEFLLRATLQTKGNKKPKTVILVVDDNDELRPSKSLKFRLDRMYPLVKYKIIRDELVKRKEKKPVIVELLVTHQLNRSNFEFKQKKFTKNDSIMACGSMPISHQKPTFSKKYGDSTYAYTRNGELIQKIKAFRSFVAMCKHNSIELIIAIPPNFRNVSSGFPERMLQMLDGYGSVFVYDKSIPEYHNPDYFFDGAHLQTKGSYIYTANLIRYYKRLHQLK